MVNNEVLAAKKIVINVGGRASVPEMPGIREVQFLTNSSMMDVDFLPEHLVIVGGSYVGLEFGQMYRRFGSEVTIVEMGPRLIGREDEDVSQAVREIFEAEGIRIRLNAKCIFLAKREGRIAVGIECKEGSPEILGTHVLGAAILGTGGDEVIHVVLDVMYAKAPYTVIQRAMHIHPTVAEYLFTVLSTLVPFA